MREAEPRVGFEAEAETAMHGEPTIIGVNTREATMTRCLVLALTLSVVFGHATGTAAEQDGETISILQTEKMEWKDYPGLPGVKFVVLAGNPSQPGLYVIRAKFAPHTMSRPHWHPEARYVTVLKGTWWAALERTSTLAAPRPSPLGASPFMRLAKSTTTAQRMKKSSCRSVEWARAGPTSSIQAARRRSEEREGWNSGFPTTCWSRAVCCPAVCTVDPCSRTGSGSWTLQQEEVMRWSDSRRRSNARSRPYLGGC